ncbi:aminodeoxychorismate/anthranilate synthase component II [Gallaecimonas sp. GXIMD4217]|uniref:anthranilate synthase component II n=1 Tax=Gallaecimonas sp. GXIMD4217 TaxID=3131927 RepID=UPI00311AFA72
MNIIMLDNQDSFTYNLVDDCRQLGARVRTFRNTVPARVVLDALAQAERPLLLLSPGPGAPDQAGCLMQVLAESLGRYPVLGVCLGHQALVQHCGGSLRRSPVPRHGKAFRLDIADHALFTGMESAPLVGRYHSLVADVVPDQLEVLARSEEQVMAVSHRRHPAIGLQFHPESLLTRDGRRLLANAFDLLGARP